MKKVLDCLARELADVILKIADMGFEMGADGEAAPVDKEKQDKFKEEIMPACLEYLQTDIINPLVLPLKRKIAALEQEIKDGRIIEKWKARYGERSYADEVMGVLPKDIKGNDMSARCACCGRPLESGEVICRNYGLPFCDSVCRDAWVKKVGV